MDHSFWKAVFLGITFSASVSNATGYFISKELPRNINQVNYWTPERLKAAKEFPLPKANIHTVKKLPLIQSHKEGKGADGAPPQEEVESNPEYLFSSTEISPILNFEQNKFLPMEQGNSTDDFSSSRLIPLNADLTYPYRAVGKLYFTIPDKGDYVCSASVIRHRIVLTAGHCLHQGSGGGAGFYTNWLFVPAYRDGVASFQTWKWTYVAVSSTWASGGGVVPNAADYGMLEMEDRPFNGIIYRIGLVTGYLGYQMQSLIPNHAHLLGYPCNLDRCQKMHQVTAQSARRVEPNNAEYGSDMRGGSSGGPWVQNFGELAEGQADGFNPGLNRVIGVTSYGYQDEKTMAQGSSILDDRFMQLLTAICNHKQGNCS